MAEYTKPLPNLNNPRTKPYWDAAKQHELRMQRCPDCGYVRYPPAPRCPECLQENDEWAALSGRGKIWSFNVYHHVFSQTFKEDIPYNVALVELEEGPRLITNIVGVPNDDLRVDMPVEVVFDDVTDEVSLVKFKPAAAPNP
jgi:uncharacterized OB-fold protein